MSASALLTRPTDSDTDDRDLVAGVSAGDDRAFELLFQRYQPRISRYVQGMVRDHGRAEDITQEVFMSALRRMRTDPERAIQFKPWIYEIAKNRCIDVHRRSRNAREVSFDAHDAVGADEHGRLADPGATPDSAVEDKVALDNLCGAFGSLTPVHHDILVLRELEGLSYREIGDRLGMSRPAVESTLFRARKRLTAEYEELVSGELCRRVQRIVDGSSGRATRLRDQRRMARHLAHCQPCRRYAARAGIDLGLVVTRPAAAAARIAAFLPFPAFLRRRWGGEDAGPLFGHGGGSVGQWSANLATVVDPGIVSGWTKAVATAATVAVAGMGAGAAFDKHAALGGWAAPDALFAPAKSAPSPEKARDAAPPAPALEQQHGAATGAAPAAAPGKPRAGAERSAADPASAGQPRTRSGTPPAQPAKQPGRPFDSNPAAPPTTGSGAQAGAGREPGPAEPRLPIGSAIGAIGSAGGDADASASSTETSSDGPAVFGGATPVRDSVGAVGDTVEPTVENVGPATAGGASVSSTVPDTIASTTTALNDLGG